MDPYKFVKRFLESRLKVDGDIVSFKRRLRISY
jgi:hypothetical protein